MDGRRYFGGNDAQTFNSGGHYAISEFQMQPAGRDDVNLDRSAAPSAAVDSQVQRRHVFSVEPPSRHPIKPVPENLDPVVGIPGGDQHSVPVVEIALPHLLQRNRVGDPGSQVVGDATHVIPSQICCATHPIKSTLRRAFSF